MVQPRLELLEIYIKTSGSSFFHDFNCYVFKLNAGTMDPIWNQQFSFNIDNEVTEVLIKIFDKMT